MTKEQSAVELGSSEILETRQERRRRRHREAILAAADELMKEKGPDATTMQEISARSDLALGTIYSYFSSKEKIVAALGERTIAQLGERIRKVIGTSEDKGHVFAYGIRCLMEASINDRGWHFLLTRPEIMTETIDRLFGPYAKASLRRDRAAKPYQIDDIDVVWRQAIWAVAAACIAVNETAMSKKAASKVFDEAVANILGMVGVERSLAKDIVRRPRPLLPVK